MQCEVEKMRGNAERKPYGKVAGDEQNDEFRAIVAPARKPPEDLDEWQGCRQHHRRCHEEPSHDINGRLQEQWPEVSGEVDMAELAVLEIASVRRAFPHPQQRPREYDETRERRNEETATTDRL